MNAPIQALTQAIHQFHTTSLRAWRLTRCSRKQLSHRPSAEQSVEPWCSRQISRPWLPPRKQLVAFLPKN